MSEATNEIEIDVETEESPSAVAMAKQGICRGISRGLENLQTARSVLRNDGPRALFRRYGWKLFAALFVYYLIRDLTIYVLIPGLIWKLS